jgi:hypothetical protein
MLGLLQNSNRVCYKPPLQGGIFMVEVMATVLFEEAAFLILRRCLRLQELD